MMENTVTDPHSFSEPRDVAVQHIRLDLRADFLQRTLSGTAALTIDNRAGTDRLVLDTRDLIIEGAFLGPERRAANFELGRGVPHLGRPLTIAIRPETHLVEIDYSTAPAAAALQWLAPEQTAGGRSPFLLTQSQAILARSWIPLQDTPAVRFSYDATIRVPPGLMALMSAQNPTSVNADGMYQFKMPQPIPSYLMALAIGDVAFQPLDERSGVYAEPAVLGKAAWEFADTPKMIAAAEALYGPYRWGRYDVLVLPPSFPFGGMENPRLTFATPTVLAGDRSLVSLVAHELAHSWSGNLVTNATWNDFWLNEGFTDYFTFRIIEELEGRDYSEMLAILARQSLADEIALLGQEKAGDTRLKLDLAGRDPDEGMTAVAYEKGYYFLRLLEESVGRARFDRFLRGYFDANAFHSMTTEQFVEYLRSNLLAEYPGLEQTLRLEAWVHEPGIPSNIPVARSTAFEKVDAQIAAFMRGTPPSQLTVSGWNSHQWVHFVRNLPEDLDAGRMKALDDAFQITGGGNSEILAVWFEKAIQSGYRDAYPALERFLSGMGRRKFLKPLYRALCGTADGKAWAWRVYEKARPGYHSVSRQTIDEILGWSAPS